MIHTLNRYKNDIRTILEMVLVYLLSYLANYWSKGFVGIVIIGLQLLYYTYRFIIIIRYRLGKSDYAVFSSQNDLSKKMGFLSLGIVLLFVSLSSLFWREKFDNYTGIGLSLGFLFLFKGIFEIGSGIIQFKESTLNISGIKEPIDEKTLKELVINEEQIKLFEINNQRQIVQDLRIEPKEAGLIEKYFNTHIKQPGFIIINQVVHEV